MSSVTIPVKASDHPNIRPLNVLRDLPAVADLIELCFSSTMDNDGQRYLSDMRRASRDDGFLKWASHLAETTSLPLTGYVWEENRRIVGNASLIPFRDKGKRVYLIANVAVHPDHRGHGIGQALTRLSMLHAFDKKAKAVWLHVRDDNPAAIKLYANLNFREIARRTAWHTRPDAFSPKLNTDIEIVTRDANFWPTQQDWLRRLYPDALAWYHGWNFNALRPGLANWLYLLFVDYSIKQWAAVRGNELLATLTWMPQGGRSDSLFAATMLAFPKEHRDDVSGETSGTTLAPHASAGGNTDEARHAEAITELLIHARRALASYSKLSLDFPAGEMTDAISAAGFQPRRTLIWMKAERDE